MCACVYLYLEIGQLSRWNGVAVLIHNLKVGRDSGRVVNAANLPSRCSSHTNLSLRDERSLFARCDARPNDAANFKFLGALQRSR